MKRWFLRIAVVLCALAVLGVVLGCRGSPERSDADRSQGQAAVDSAPMHDFRKAAIEAIREYISTPAKRELRKSTTRFLENPIVTVEKARSNKPFLAMFRQHCENKDALAEIAWERAMLGTLRCGIGGGYFISVALDSDTAKPLAVAVIPGE